jgi:hypothetical protein
MACNRLHRCCVPRACATYAILTWCFRPSASFCHSGARSWQYPHPSRHTLTNTPCGESSTSFFQLLLVRCSTSDVYSACARAHAVGFQHAGSLISTGATSPRQVPATAVPGANTQYTTGANAPRGSAVAPSRQGPAAATPSPQRPAWFPLEQQGPWSVQYSASVSQLHTTNNESKVRCNKITCMELRSQNCCVGSLGTSRRRVLQYMYYCTKCTEL